MTDAETEKKLNDAASASGGPAPAPDMADSINDDANGAGLQTVEEHFPGSLLRDKSGGIFGSLSRTLQGWRATTLRHTPAFVVNHASNFIGLLHVFAETLMLKSAGITYMQNNRGGDKANPLIDPANNIRRAITGEDKLDANGGVFQNDWQARSTSIGFTSWVVGSTTSESKDNNEKIDKSVKLYKEHPLKYFVQRAAQGLLWFNPKYKRQQIGFGVTMAGLCSVISGHHNVNLLKRTHFSNLPHSINGVLTVFAGLQLWFAPDSEQGWKHYGLTMFSRLALLPFTVYNKFSGHDRWAAYASGQGAFFAADAMAYLLGGAEKRADGTLIDHHAELVAAQHKYAKKPSLAPSASPVPATTVSQASRPQLALDASDTAERTAR